MSLIQAITIIENELRAESKRAGFLRDSYHLQEPHKRRKWNMGFWSGNKQGLDFAIEKIKELRRLTTNQHEQR